MYIIGHRGKISNNFYEENTLESFNTALIEGASWIEFDVRKCSDGGIVVIHDDTTATICHESYKINNIKINDWKKLKTKNGYSLPTLEDILTNLYNRKCGINIEIKDDCVNEVCSIVNKSNWNKEYIVITSYVPTDINKTLHNHNLRAGLLIDTFEELDNIEKVEWSNNLKKLVILNHNLINIELITFFKQYDFDIWIYTLNDLNEDMIEWIYSEYIDGIITDCPHHISNYFYF